MTISMKSFVVLVFVVGTALCAPDTRARREVLPGDPRYGTDYRHEHQHHGGGNGGSVGGDIQVVKALGRYAGTFSGSGPAQSVNVPFATYGPPNHRPGTPIGQNNHQDSVTQQLAPIQVQQPQHHHHHVVQQAPQRPPAIPATSYGVPQYNFRPQPQPQPNYVQQPTYQAPQQRPVLSQLYVPLLQQSLPSVHRPAPQPQPSANSGHFAPVVQQRPVVHIQPQPQPQPQVQYVQVQHQPQPQPQFQYVEQQPQPQQVQQQHVHVQHHQQQSQQIQQTEHVHHEVSRPVNSYGAPVQQSQPTYQYVPQAVEASAPVSQEEVSYNVVHDEPAEGGIRANNDQFFPQLPSLPDGAQFGGFPIPSFPTDFSGPFGPNQITQFFGGNSPKPDKEEGDSHASAEPPKEDKARSFPTLDLQSNIVSDYQVVGSGRTGVSSGYPKEQPQSTIQYVSPVSSPVAESVVVESAPVSSSTNSQQVDSNGGYLY